MNLLRHIFTGKDNCTYDIGRIMGFAIVLEFLALAAWTVCVNKMAFDMQSFGIGSGAIVGTWGAAMKLKEKSEPDVPDVPKDGKSHDDGS